MPRYIIKMERDGEERYLEWSTIVDAPVTYGMGYDEFLEYYRDEYGAHSMDGLLGEHGRMRRVRAHGTSARMDESVHQTIAHNRAGDGETELDFDGIWEKYVVGRPTGDDEEEPTPSPEDVLGDFYRLCAMLGRAGVDFRETLKLGKRILDIPVGSTTVRFTCDADGRLQRVEPGEAPTAL